MVVYLKNVTKGLSLPTGHWRLEKREEFVWLFDHDLNLRLTVILLKCLDLLKGKQLVFSGMDLPPLKM